MGLSTLSTTWRCRTPSLRRVETIANLEQQLLELQV
jgi:hypothetical protein